jgi:hypothetical protein
MNEKKATRNLLIFCRAFYLQQAYRFHLTMKYFKINNFYKTEKTKKTYRNLISNVKLFV